MSPTCLTSSPTSFPLSKCGPFGETKPVMVGKQVALKSEVQGPRVDFAVDQLFDLG